MDGTILSQGSFIVPAGVPAQQIAIPSAADFMWVKNYTQAGIDGAANTGVNFYWQRGMPAGGGMVEYKTVAGVAGLSVTTFTVPGISGFTLLDTSVQQPGAPFAVTGISAANPPVVLSATTPALGSVVRLSNIANMNGISGLDFTVTAINAGVSFSIGNATLLNSVAGLAGFWRLIPFDPIFYPRRRYITWIRVGNPTVVYLSVTHQYAVGQKVRFDFGGNSNPGVWGAFQVLDGLDATITAVNVARAGAEPTNAAGANNVQLAIDTSALPAWNTINTVFPNTNTGNNSYPAGNSYVPFTPAQLIPEGEDSAVSLVSPLAQVPLEFPGAAGSPAVLGANVGLLSDATVNVAFIGMTLGVGGAGNGATLAGGVVTGPAGSVAGDLMFWAAGKSSLGGL